MPITLRVVSFNDVYSLENLPRLKNLVKHHAEVDRADGFAVVVAGDFLAPSLLSSLDSGRGMVDCLNAVGVTYAVFGNHEDDVPVAELRQRVFELRATWIATNVRDLEPPLPARAVHEVRGRDGATLRVGLVGVVMNDPAVYRDRPFGGATVDNANEAAKTEAAKLLAEGCAFVLAVTHQPMPDDRALARADWPRSRGARPLPSSSPLDPSSDSPASPLFPVILGGHEHVVLVEHVEGTWIVKAGQDAAHAAVVEVAWDPAYGTVAASVRVDSVAAYPEDAELRARVEAHMAKVHALEGVTLLSLEPGQKLSSVGMRSRQTTLGTLVCSHLRDAIGADACLLNAGGIRGSRDYEDRLTYSDIKSEMPFDNEVVVVRLPGRVVREAVAASRAHAPAESAGFLQVDDGIAVSENHSLAAIAGVPLEEDRDYRVAVVRELLLGMDHIEPLVRYAAAHPERIPAAGSGREAKLVLANAFSLALWRQLGAFDAIDANDDGVVTPEELATALSRIEPVAAAPIAAELVLHALEPGPVHPVTREEIDAAEKTSARTGLHKAPWPPA